MIYYKKSENSRNFRIIIKNVRKKMLRTGILVHNIWISFNGWSDTKNDL